MIEVIKSVGMLIKFKLHWLRFDESIGVNSDRTQTFWRDTAKKKEEKRKVWSLFFIYFVNKKDAAHIPDTFCSLWKTATKTEHSWKKEECIKDNNSNIQTVKKKKRKKNGKGRKKNIQGSRFPTSNFTPWHQRAILPWSAGMTSEVKGYESDSATCMMLLWC